MPTVTKTCAKCSAAFVLTTSPANIARQKFCSRVCMSAAFRAATPSWDVSMASRLRDRSAARSSGCIEYTGQKGVYGHIEYRRKTYLAHRVAWTLSHGQIPKGMQVCHRCDNPICINVDHLFLGSAYENAYDRDQKGRGRWNPRKRLSDSEILAIRADLSAGLLHEDIAAKYGISSSYVSMIKTGRRRSDAKSLSSRKPR